MAKTIERQTQPITKIGTQRFGRGGMIGEGYFGSDWLADLIVRITSTYNSLNKTFVNTKLPDGREASYVLGNPNLITRRRKIKEDTKIDGVFSYGAHILSARVGPGGENLIVRIQPSSA